MLHYIYPRGQRSLFLRNGLQRQILEDLSHLNNGIHGRGKKTWSQSEETCQRVIQLLQVDAVSVTGCSRGGDGSQRAVTLADEGQKD